MTKDKLDLSDLLIPGRKPPKLAKVIDFDDLLHVPRISRLPKEVVLFWTDWTCQCGKHYEMPTYGDSLTRYDQYRYGKLIASVYQKYLPVNHKDLPRRIEANHIHITHCPQCLSEDQVELDRQGDLFDAA